MRKTLHSIFMNYHFWRTYAFTTSLGFLVLALFFSEGAVRIIFLSFAVFCGTLGLLWHRRAEK